MIYLLLIAGAYALICLLVFLLQGRLVYLPERGVDATPARMGFPYDEVMLETEDDVRVHAWFIPGDPGTRALLFAHGNAGNISHRLDSIGLFHDLGLSVLIFDYRGYGKSEGRAGEAGTYRDARAAWRHLVDERGYEPGNIVLFGRSLGGAVVIELATRVTPGALIVESSFTSMVEMGARVYPFLPVRLLSRIHYDSAGRVPGITCPKLFIHSPDDDVVPFDLGRKLFDLAAEPKTFLQTDGGHNQGAFGRGSQYAKGLQDFLNGLDSDGSRAP